MDVLRDQASHCVTSNNAADTSTGHSARHNSELERFRRTSQDFARAYCQLQLKAETYQHNLRGNDARFAEIVQALPGGILLLDEAGLVEYCNAAAEEFLGKPLQGQAWLNIIERAFAPRLDDGHEISLKDGRLLSLSTRSIAGHSGQLLMLTDATATRQLQEERHRDERLTALGKMVAALAHQLKTPLAAATLYASHLQPPALSLDKYARFSEKISTQLRTIDRQIRDMLVFAGGDVRLSERVAIDDFAADLDDSVQFVLREVDIDYTLSLDVGDRRFVCNPDVLREALMNLVNNAVEASAVSRLSIAFRTTENDELLISICDNGDGFEPAASKALAEPFHSTKAQGTGLGLAVVRAVVSAHAGKFDIESVAGEGVTATIHLPLLAESSQEAKV
jgi:two-component system sensor histidine kinase FlrB